MPSFLSVHDLERSLQSAGLQAQSRDIAATLRPVILFLRQQVPDAPLPAGISKIGGDPDLPADFAWPERPPLADADQRARAIERRGSETAKRQFERQTGYWTGAQLAGVIEIETVPEREN